MEDKRVSFRKRLTISFGIIIVVPVLLFAIAFQVLGSYMAGKTGINLYSMTDAAGLISGDFMSSLFLCMILILLFTALLLTRWLEKSFFGPISVLNKGMNHIRDGNLDFILKTDEKGEIGELYQNYEEMRLRLKESQEEKLLQEKQNRELLSNISHDLKTPITSIKGYVEGLIDGVANTPEKQDKYIRTIYNKANDMDRLIDELTLYSRIDSDRVPYNFHRINVGDYFGDCVEEIGMDLESRGIELNYSNLIAPETRIIGDPEQLKRVINNIVGNSVKYLDKPHGRIMFRKTTARALPPEISLTYLTGSTGQIPPGIPPKAGAESDSPLLKRSLRTTAATSGRPVPWAKGHVCISCSGNIRTKWNRNMKI